MTAKRHGVRVTTALLFIALALRGDPLFACDDYILTEEALNGILDNSLGKLRALTSEHSVRVDPGDAACYLKMKVTLFGCELSACSKAVANLRKLGIEQFTINGCGELFALARQDPIVKTSYTDVTDKIRAHCGSDAFQISNLLPERSGANGVVRLVLVPIQ